MEVWTVENIEKFPKKYLLTESEVNELNEGKWRFMEYYKGKLENNSEYDYYLIPATGSFVVKVKKN